jgi:cytochrome c6
MTLRPFAALLAVTAIGATPVLADTVDGHQTFMQNCAACHQATGKGIPGAFPALAGDKFVTGDPAKPVATVLNGRGGMPAWKDSLSDAQIAAALSYARSSWGNKAPPVDAKLVAKLRGAPASKASAPLQAH